MKSKVLLIDDSVTIHRVIDLSIDIDRYDIVKVFSKEDAALKMQSEQYDYILLDNKLDNIMITEYIKELKVAQPSASIILLVGAFDRFDESNLEKTGADDYLVKPFDSQSLNEKLSSDADMMPAGIVEKIAEADFARDNDDYITPTASLTTGDTIEGMSKQGYLENLEEVQPDDLTDNGYVEDLDHPSSLEFDKDAEPSAENIQESDVIAENNIANTEESGDVSKEPVIEENIEEVHIDEPVNNTTDENIEPDAEPSADSEPQSIAETEGIEPLEEEIPIEENAEEISSEPLISEEVEIPDNITAIHNPILPDIDNAENISDEFVMQDNLADVDNQGEMLNEFPDFPDVDDVSTDEVQDTLEVEDSEKHEEESVEEPNIEEEQELINDIAEDNDNIKMQEEENLLVDDDNWLSDAEENTQVEENIEPNVENTEEQQEVVESNTNEEDLLENTLQNEDAELEEETIDEVVPLEESVIDENEAQVEDIAGSEENEELASNDIQEEVAENDSIESNDNIDNADNEPSLTPPLEEEILPVIEGTGLSLIKEAEETIDEALEVTSEENITDIQEEINEEPAIIVNEEQEEQSEQEEPTLLVENQEVMQEVVPSENTDTKHEEVPISNTSAQFGGITVSISRDEIMAMLGNAIDKHFLEEAVKEVIATNMKEIVRNIVPAIAEKYIKEEIERLKNDE